MNRSIIFLAFVFLFCFGQRLYSDPVVSYKGKTLSLEDLGTKTRLQVYEAELEAYQAKRKALEQYIFELHVSDYASAKGLEIEEAERRLLANKPVTDTELKAFYEANRSKIPYPFAQVKEELSRFVQSQKMEDGRNQVLAKLLSDPKTKIYLDPPQAPKVTIEMDAFYAKGPPKAKVVIVEFADYTCPHCRDAYLTLDKLVKAHPENIRLVFIDFAFLSQLSKQLAAAAYCAHQQNAFWPYHGLIFEKQAELSEASILAFAKQLNLNAELFNRCLSSEAAEAMVEKGKTEGERLGVTGTPTLFINGSRYLGEISFAALNAYVGKLLKPAP